MMDDLGHLVRSHNPKGDSEERRRNYQATTGMVKNCRMQRRRAVDDRAQALQAGGAVVLKKFVEGGLKKQEFNKVKDVFSKEKERDPEKYIGRNGKLMLLSDTEEGEDSPAESPLPSQQPVENLELNGEERSEETTETHRKVRSNLADNNDYVEEARKSGSEEENDGTAPDNGTENHQDGEDLDSNGTEYHQDGEGLASESAKTASVEGDKLKRSQASQSKKRRGRRRANRNDSKKPSGRKGSNTADYSSSDSDDGCKRKQAEADNETRPPARKRRRRKLAVQGPQLPSHADLDPDMDDIIELDSDRVYCYCQQWSSFTSRHSWSWMTSKDSVMLKPYLGAWFCRDCKKKYGEAMPLRQPEQLKVIKVEVVDGEEQMSYPQNQNADHNSGMGNNTLAMNASIRPWLIYGTVGMQRPLDTIVQLDEAGSYCICSRISHELLVMCRNEKCALVWFHLNCVGLKCTAERGAGEEQERSRVRGIDTATNGRAPAAPVAYDPDKIIKQEMVSDDDA
ncbi:unnamed protein product [Heligmosomoides polygyrus]|uniref:PHD domain-containing protein n=1 Tax=Heligmosomoides polygyrus TaxID=6339 RepID=A0A183GEN7_HELPZ|nr:unnamed protein product [Heligmosomoides polygyrus]